MAAVALAAGISVPYLSDLTGGGSYASSLETVDSLISQARQQAIRNNSFVWLAYSTDEEASTAATVLAIIESPAGLDAINWSSRPVYLSRENQLKFSGEVYHLEGFRIKDTQVDDDSSSGAGEIHIVLDDQGQELHLTRGIQFTPTGEARSRTRASTIDLEFGVSDGEALPSRIIRITAASGRTDYLTKE